MGRAIFSLLLLALIAVGDAHVEYRSRPHYSFYTNTGDRVPIINQAGHRRAVRAAMPIPRRPTANPTTTVAPATQVSPIDESGYCHTWSQQHYRTFDGKTYNFHGACTYTLVTDCVDYSFHVYVENDLDCQDGRHNNTCYKSILIDNGNPASMIYLRPGGRAYYKNEELTLPTKAGGLVLERIAHVVLATSGLGFTILYDGEESITIYITSDSLQGHTCGLCGVYDMDPSNDFRMPSGAIASDAYTFGLSWKGMDERDPAYCPDVPTEPLRCSQYTTFESDEQQEKAEFAISECAHLLHGTFMACHQVVDPQPYITACEQDVCACEMVEQSDGSLGNDCKCAAFTAYTQECARRGYQVSWRSIDFCPFTCPADKVYDQCGSACTQKGCSTAIADCETDGTVGCIEGCHCPAGTYRSTSGECVSANQCFCAWQGNEYEPGQTISDGCNECNCVDGKWQCSNNDCGGMCQVGGLGHYHTFDSYDYDFAGTCSYTLVKDCWNPLDSSVVYIENSECGMEGASCVKAVVLHEGANVVRLRRGHQVLANGQEVTEFPVTVGNIFVNQPTQHQTAAVMSNGLTILFDGNNHVIVMADERHINSTCGLCGTYNNNQRDDFYTEAGDIESNPSSFANKWKLGTSCQDSTDDQTTDPCDLYSQKSLTAEEDCFKLYDDAAFAACRQYVDPEVYYESCRSDVCNCETGDSCKCEIFAMYASQCAQKGVVIDWRSKIPGCGIDCEGGLVYSACHTMCETTCNALSSTATCDETCVEGCACPDGSVMSASGACVPPENCGCVDRDTGVSYAPGDSIAKGCGTCVCESGTWTCDGLDCPADECKVNEEYSTCASGDQCRKTCANMHEFEGCSPATCYGGCVCTEFTVWNGTSCVLPTSCPCHHGGHSYEEGAVIQTDECHSCTCENSRWNCYERNCHGVCTAWGDPHYKTFDGKLFDFQGDCDYVLVTDSVSQASGIAFFHVVIGNIPCGTSGVTCTKSITFTIGTGANQEKMQLVRGKPVPQSAGSFEISLVGSYVYVHTKIGITLIWDQGTWIQVKLDPMYKGKVGGLCGNFNDLVSDDFLSPAGGLPETSSIDFGDGWKVHEYCPRPSHILHPCIQNPFRRAWAMRQCSVIKSDLFADCHSEVNYRPYYTRCVFDTCGCDYGGDCECLCTAISAYAQECNANGVPIRWRSNDLCPIQCDGCREYDPCIPVCNVCGHEDRWDENGECPDTCVEGCNCPPGQFYQDGECVEECAVTTPPATTPYVTTPPPWETTTTPHADFTTPAEESTTRPITHLPTTTERSTTAGPTTSPTTTESPSSVAATTPGILTPPPYTPPFNACYCSGYGDPHYKDFNDNEFDHQGNCTYILSRDIRYTPPRYVVLIHTMECERFPGTTCPKDIEIDYKGYKIILLSDFSPKGEYLLVVDNILYVPPFNTSEFIVFQSGIDFIFQGFEIGLEVRFIPYSNGYFSVEVPEAQFFNSTDGLCGNCGVNDTTCEEDTNCCDLVFPPEDRENCGCEEITTPCPPTDGSIEWCSHIYDPEFAPCHDYVDPEPFFKDCLYDHCYANDTTCWSFEAYAIACSRQGICLDWRADDFCPMDCEEPMEYRECACPTEEFPSCTSYDPTDPMCGTEPVSGCFCPEGTMPVGDNTCVPCPTPTVPATPSTTTTECVEKWYYACIWSIWYNDEAGGQLASDADEETESLEDIQHIPDFPAFCVFPKDVECRTVDTHMFANETDDAATCDVNRGLFCKNSPNTPRCRDYEVRFLCCGQIHTVTCGTEEPPETTPAPPPPPPPTPAPQTTTEPPFSTFVPPPTTAEPPGTTSGPPGDTTTSVTLPPSSTGKGEPPGTRPPRPTPPPTTPNPPATTECVEQWIKVCAWSIWFDGEGGSQIASDADGETELVSDIQHFPQYPDNCATPEDIECRTVDTDEFANETDDGAICDLRGLICKNLPGLPRCRNYKIRLLCCALIPQVTCSTRAPPETTAAPPGTTSGPPGTTAGPPETTAAPPGTTAGPPGTTAAPPGTTSGPPGTTAGPPGTTAAPPGTTSGPPSTTAAPPQTTGAPPSTTECVEQWIKVCAWSIWFDGESGSEIASDADGETELVSDIQHFPQYPDNCATPEDLECRTVDTHEFANETDDGAICDLKGLICKNIPGLPRCRNYEVRFYCCALIPHVTCSTRAPPETTAAPTTAAPPGTTAAPPGTTGAPPGTTSGPPGTTAGPPGTTAAPPGTTSGPPSTTAAPPLTTGAPPSTTECVEQWIKVCAWSIWFDGESGSQIASDADGETELVSDIQHFPQYPDNCATPEDIECRTVDTDEFANETDDGAICDLRGLICKNLPGLPRCHNYKVRLLCCALIPQVTCSTRAPPETTAAPPGTTTGPPGTTAAPPGTTSGPPGTTAGPPGTTAAPPGTTAGSPGTTAAPPGTTSGPPSTTAAQPQTTGAPPSTTECVEQWIKVCAWSIWFDGESGSEIASDADGETELVSDIQHFPQYPENCATPEDIECRTVDTNEFANETDDGAICDLRGLICKNLPGLPRCRNYKVRLLCCALIPQVTCSTRAPPETTAAPPGTTSGPPGTTAGPPGTTAGPPGTTSGPPGTTAGPPGTTAAPPGTTAGPPGTTAAPPGTTSGPPGTTAGPPGTTAAPPGTTAGPPGTTAAPPGTTSGPPGTTAGPPGTTAAPPGTTAGPPGTTAAPPGTTSGPPGTTAGPPGTTAAPPGTTAGPPGTTAAPPGTTSGPPSTTAAPPQTTGAPPSTTECVEQWIKVCAWSIWFDGESGSQIASDADGETELVSDIQHFPQYPENCATPEDIECRTVDTNEFANETDDGAICDLRGLICKNLPGLPRCRNYKVRLLCCALIPQVTCSTRAPPETTAAPPGTTSGPPGTTAGPPGTTAGPPGTTSGPPGTTAGPPGTTAAPPGTTAGPPGTTAAPPGTTSGPPGTTAGPPGTTAAPPGTTAGPPGTTAAPPGTTSGPPGTTAGPPGTTAAPPGTTAGPPGTTAAPPGTTSGPPGTTAGPPGTTAAPPGPTAGPPGTTAAPPGTTSGPPGTTAGPPGTTAAPPGTTAGPPGTTAAPPGTTSGPPSTTAAPPQTTGAPPSTTECVEQWIKVCAWSIWFDGESGSQIASDADGETELVSDIQHFPQYPENCATPEDIECRTVDTNEFANETDDGAICDLRGLICKNLPGLPRCRNYKVRLLCCALIPQVTCSTRAPPETTAAPPGTTSGPPGTTAGPPGTTAGPPGTTSGPPGTTAGPPGTTAAPPGTTAGPPGTTAGPPGTTAAPPGTTSGPPGTTAGPPGTTAAPPGTTAGPPGTTAAPPGTTSGPPSTTAAPPQTTGAPPSTTECVEQWIKVCAWSIWFDGESGSQIASDADGETELVSDIQHFPQYPDNCATPEDIECRTVDTDEFVNETDDGAICDLRGLICKNLPGLPRCRNYKVRLLCCALIPQVTCSTRAPPETTAAPPGTTAGPPGTTAAPPGTTSGPPGTTAGPPGTTAAPPGTTAGPPGTTAAPPGTTSGPPGTTAGPPGTTAAPPGTTSGPPGTTAGPPGTTAAPPGTTAGPPGTTAAPPGTTSGPPGTTAGPPGTTAGPPGTTAGPPGTTAAPPGTTSGPPGTTAGPPGTTAAPPGTTAGPPGTTAAPPGTTAGPPGTTAAPPGTTSGPPGTTAGPPGTTAAPPGTTAGPPGTTAVPPVTTSGPPTTTAAPPETTGAPPSTTECVEQWIKVCAWSIWFDGESGSQIASDADGETELVSDIQHFPQYPDNCATPEDIECRTVDTDEFANETDDGAICDLRGLICKNLPGLPRCRNYKVRLLCCALIPQVTCSTRAPPGTTAAPPGTTAGPPGTTAAPPGTTAGPPGTTAAPPGTTSGPPGTTTGPPGTTAAPPGTTSGPPGTTSGPPGTTAAPPGTTSGPPGTTAGPPGTTAGPPGTTAAPPGTTAGPPGTTAGPPGTTAAPPSTTSGPPGTTAGPPGTTAAPPGTTAGPPGTTAAPPSTTSGPPGTTAGPPGTTAAPPGTTSGPPGTTSGPPGTTAAPPGTTSGPPGTTAGPPGTTAGPPGTTAAPPGTTAAPPGTTAGPPGTTAAPPGTTSGPPGTTAGPPGTTAAPPGTTAGPPGTTAAPPGTTSGPPTTTAAPPQTTGAPPSTTECVEQWIKVCAWSIWFDGESGSQIASDADGETELVSDIQQFPQYPDNCATPEDIECRTVDTDEFANETDDGAICDLRGLICKNLPGLPRCRNYKVRLLCCALIPQVTCSTRAPPETTAAPPGTTSGPPGTTAAPPGTTAGPPGTTAGPPGTTAGPPGTTAAPPGTTAGPPGTTAAPPGTTAGPPGTTAAPPGTTSGPPGTTAGPPGTTAAPPGTTAGPPGTTAAPPGTTAGPPGTTAAPPGTTSGPPGTTAGPPGTTAAPPGTTAGPPGTTAAPPGTTSGPPTTTAAPPQTTGAPPSTTECVEQWIKVCAWSIWFDGESGSQIASDADGETELVSDIQQFPQYPDNCATPEDIECRTVDTDEFANETDDGAICDLRGLICKNLPGLPRCRNYKVRLLCCALIPQVTCSTRAPPETTAAPPGSTTGPPGTTAGPPGTTAGPPGTTAGPPGTTAAPPGTTAGPPGTTAAPPGTTSGPPGTTAGPPGTTAGPPGTTAGPPGTTAAPPGTTAGPPGTTAAPPGTTSGPPGTTAGPPGTTAGPPGTTAGPPGTTAAPPGTTSGPPGTTAGPPGTTAAPPGTTSGPPGTTSGPPGTTAAPPGTTSGPPGTTAGPPGTTAGPQGTTAGPPGTTAGPPGTTAGPPGTTAAPPGTTSGPPGTTAGPPGTTAAPPVTTVGPPGTTAAPPGTTSGPPTTTSAPPQTTGAPPSTTECVEQWIKVCAWSIWFDGESGSQIASDADGETELVSDIQQFPQYPDNCATPEDIECRTVDTDEFANETDDGAICDLRGLICKNLPGLPRCRNYKVRLLCCALIPQVTCSTRAPPETTAAPPGPTSGPPGTTAGPPGTTAAPPGTTAGPPGTTAAPPGTTAGPPGTTAAPPGTTSGPPGTTAGPPGTTAGPPGTTVAPPGTTAGPPGTTAAPPGTTSGPPSTTSGSPGTTAAPPGTTSGPPGTTAGPPGTTAGPPGTTAGPPGTTAAPPGTTSGPPGTTAGPPGTTAAPPGTTVGPPGTTAAPPGTTSGPPTTTSAPPQTTGAPPSTTECIEQWIKVCAWSIWFDGESGSQIASDADGETELVSDIQQFPQYPDNCATPEDIECRTVDTDEFANETDDGAICDLRGLICKNLPGLPRCRNYKVRLLCCALIPQVTCSTRAPPETTAAPPGTTSGPPGTTAGPPGTTAGPPGTTAGPPGTTAAPPGTTAGPPGTTAAPPGTTAGPPGTTAGTPGTTGGPPGTTAGPPGTTAAPPGTTAGPPGTTAAPPGTTSGPPGTTAGPPGTTAGPPGTTAGPPGTTAAPPGTTAGPPGTTAAPPGTTSGPPGTTAGPPGTTAAPPGTTFGPPGTTAAPPGTTSGPPTTTSAPPQTTGAPPSTTECVEQWIKVCAWSIWFDGESGSQIASDADGETELVSDIQQFPQYPDNCATPEDIECRTVDTDEFANETDDGAICDLRGLICKNLPGLPRCRNYKVRLLCCALIPQVTCSTRAPPETTAAPPGTTSGPPGTTAGPPGTTAGPPGTTAGPPGTTAAPPGTTAGPPGTTAAPPGTTAGPPGTTAGTPGTTAGPPGTTAGPPGTTAAPPGTTAGPPGTTAAPPGTTSGPPGTTAGPPGTTAGPPGTTAGPPGTTAAPPGTTAGPPGTTAAPPGTTSGPPGTTAGPPGTTAAPPGTTFGPPGTTAAPPGTTSGPPTTTSAPPQTTGAPPSTTECVEQWIKVCAWSIWFDGESGSQIASDADGETELVSDIQQFPQYPDNCATPEDIECRTVDTDEFANETDDGAICDLRGLICKNLPGLPRCRNYKVRLLCCALIPQVTCSTRAPPETTAAPPGTTSGPPGTTAGPPGTTAAPPGTTAGPPGTTAGPPSTTAGPPGTTAAPPGTTIGPPGTTTGPPGTTAGPPGTTAGPPPPFTSPPSTTGCVTSWILVCVWSVWFDDDRGIQSQYAPQEEVELLADIKHLPDFPQECENPRDIECRTVDTHVFSNETSDGATCDIKTGLQCQNYPRMPKCNDYEVRFECCRKHYTVTCSTPEPPTTTSVTTSPEQTTEGCHIEEVCEWTPWCDDEEPDGKVTPYDVGEFEIIDDCRAKIDFCEEPSDIECQMSQFPNLDTSIVPQEVTCDVDFGLVCLHSESQPSCLDFRIRFLCCQNVTVGPNCPTTVPVTETTTEEEQTPTPTPTPVVTEESTTPPKDVCSSRTSSESTLISYRNCTSMEPVYLTECAGNCPSTYSFDTIIDGVPTMDEDCTCCRPSSVIEEQIELQCPDNSKLVISIPVIAECTCHPVSCPAVGYGKK
ncbi:uncharacterized protein [Diadema setosum]|uniref:uncharacterized protein n=1 Tax=Diadema setosum TaxID=31175 RepID=UPI003B3A195B